VMFLGKKSGEDMAVYCFAQLEICYTICVVSSSSWVVECFGLVHQSSSLLTEVTK